MKNRTNTYDRVLEYIIKSIIPITLAVSLLMGGVTSSIHNLLLAGTYMMYPENAVKMFKEEKDNNSDVKKDTANSNAKGENTVSTTTAVVTNSIIPNDIQKLIDEAESKYKNSSNDGKIQEVDYSTQNATAEYDGIYLRNTTLSHTVNIQDYMNRQVSAAVDPNKPTVFIYHTHTTETYELLDRGYYTNERGSRSKNSAENMIRIGEEICKALEKNGYKTIHDKTVYDEKYSGAYDRSRERAAEILKDNPSIQIVLDVHRDAIYQKNNSKVKPVTEINGVKAAQIMLISGCEDGNVTNFPNWEKNLTFAIQLQSQVSKDNPKLMRPLMLASRKYNMDLMPCALLVEFGTDANTLAEAVYSAQLFGESLSKFLKEYKI